MERPRVGRNLVNPRIVILGAGNVATHLCRALSHKCTVVQIWSRNIDHAKELAADIDGAQALSNICDIVRDADYYIISVPDNAIARLASQLPAVSGIVAHTSGSVNLQALTAGANKQLGVFYPLQTFTKSKPVDFSEIPFFIEGSDDSTADSLTQLAQLLSANVYHANSEQRASLHIAAVFACNFANRLWGVASDLLGKAGYSFDILKPLLSETLNKAFQLSPEQAQTGPARRGDTKVINAHLAKLSGDNYDLYKLITKMIIEKQNEQNKF